MSIALFYYRISGLKDVLFIWFILKDSSRIRILLEVELLKPGHSEGSLF